VSYSSVFGLLRREKAIDPAISLSWVISSSRWGVRRKSPASQLRRDSRPVPRMFRQGVPSRQLPPHSSSPRSRGKVPPVEDNAPSDQSWSSRMSARQSNGRHPRRILFNGYPKLRLRNNLNEPSDSQNQSCNPGNSESGEGCYNGRESRPHRCCIPPARSSNLLHPSKMSISIATTL
jgi:hypothetical protein